MLPPMSDEFVAFLCSKAWVTMEFVRAFQQATNVWDMDTFIEWFSSGITLDVARRFESEFVGKYKMMIIKLSVLSHFLGLFPLERNTTSRSTADPYTFSSFQREEFWYFMQRQRRTIKDEWDFVFHHLMLEMTEKEDLNFKQSTVLTESINSSNDGDDEMKVNKVIPACRTGEITTFPIQFHLLRWINFPGTQFLTIYIQLPTMQVDTATFIASL